MVKKNEPFEREGPKARDVISKIDQEIDVELMRTIGEEFDSLGGQRAADLMEDLSGKTWTWRGPRPRRSFHCGRP